MPKVGEFHVMHVHTGVHQTEEADPCTEEPAPGDLVCKFQRPIMGGPPPGEYPSILVYNQSRTIMTQLHPSPEIEILFGPDDVKAYAVCEMQAGLPVPVKRVKAQPW